MSKDSGIYKITNLVNNKVYIGSSINIYQRKLRHFQRLRKNKHFNNHLQNAWNKYGEKNFKFETIIRDVKNLFELETVYIIAHDSLNPEKGYNMDIPSSDERLKLPEELIEEKRRTAYKQYYGETSEEEYQLWREKKLNPSKKDLTNHPNCIPIKSIDKNDNEIIYKSLAEAARQLNTHQESIRKVIRGQNKTHRTLKFERVI